MEDKFRVGDEYWVGTKRDPELASLGRRADEKYHTRFEKQENISKRNDYSYRALFKCRSQHVSDGAPRNFHMFCGLVRLENYGVKRRGCNSWKAMKRGDDCVRMKVNCNNNVNFLKL